MQKLIIIGLFLVTGASYAQVDLNYYLPPDINYDDNIPKPKDIIGHEVGEWHVSHDKLLYYMKAVASASNRVIIQEMGLSHEDRSQVLLIITSPSNHSRLEEIRLEHKKLTNPSQSPYINLDNMPVVLWQGFSIHGNEPSGSNAALVAAYHYAAAQGPEIQELLDNTIILLDPCFNPDGLNRFSSWVNSNRSKNLIADPNNREQNEIWPRGRTNHYQFDLNRDWLPIQQPESKNRIRQFHRWKPNILTDHHEMGTSSTFFFQPGIPSRTNPNTPGKNQELTAKIGDFHAKALDKIQSLYYSQEDYDDFYYGKGSTFPDIQGSIGILFEQASSRGHAQESPHGVLTFPFTIRNQFTTILSTAEAAVSLRQELLEYQRNFYREALIESMSDKQKAIVFGSVDDMNRSKAMAEILAAHEIDVYQLSSDTRFAGMPFKKNTSYLVPLEQPQSQLIKIMFEEVTTFRDSLFYDVSSWTLPHAFNLNFTYLDSRQLEETELGTPFNEVAAPSYNVEKSEFAYAFRWDDYYAPKLLWKLLDAELIVKVATKPFYSRGLEFPVGSVMISNQIQDLSGEDLLALLKEASAESQVQIHAINSGNTGGVNLGSRTLALIEKPEIAMLVEDGISSNDAGEIWHLLDNRFDIPVSLVPMRVFNKINLDRYNVLIFPQGNYQAASASKMEAMKKWIQKGGTLISFKGANSFLKTNEVISIETSAPSLDNSRRKSYADLQANRGAQQTGGAIFKADLDTTHPIGYGYKERTLPVFVNSNTFFKVPNNPYAYPLQFTQDPLMSGYVSEENLDRIKGKAAIIVSQIGRGRIVSFSFNPNFRAFWYGTNKLFLNAIFFANIVDGRSAD